MPLPALGLGSKVRASEDMKSPLWAGGWDETNGSLYSGVKLAALYLLRFTVGSRMGMMETCRNEVPRARLVISSSFISPQIGSLHC